LSEVARKNVERKRLPKRERKHRRAPNDAIEIYIKLREEGETSGRRDKKKQKKVEKEEVKAGREK